MAELHPPAVCGVWLEEVVLQDPWASRPGVRSAFDFCGAGAEAAGTVRPQPNQAGRPSYPFRGLKLRGGRSDGVKEDRRKHIAKTTEVFYQLQPGSPSLPPRRTKVGHQDTRERRVARACDKRARTRQARTISRAPFVQMQNGGKIMFTRLETITYNGGGPRPILPVAGPSAPCRRRRTSGIVAFASSAARSLEPSSGCAVADGYTV